MLSISVLSLARTTITLLCVINTLPVRHYVSVAVINRNGMHFQNLINIIIMQNTYKSNMADKSNKSAIWHY